MYTFMFGKNGKGGFWTAYGDGEWCQAFVGLIARGNTCGLERAHREMKVAGKHKLAQVAPGF